MSRRASFSGAALVLGIVAALAGHADAYPQYQLSYDQTCTGCHISPSGGGLLNENGLGVAETMSQLGQAPKFFYGKVPTPDWLTLGGDLRGAAGYMQTPEKVLAAFPMQADLYAAAQFSNVTLYATAGYRPAQFGNRAATTVWSREHYLMWQQNPGEASGLFVRAGRFMPVFGLRFAEHPIYTRRFGGTPLYAETYGVHVAQIDPRFEVHATGYFEDPLISTVDHNTGGAIYGEYRLTEQTQVGGGFKYGQTEDDKHYRYVVTAKQYIPAARLLLQTELQFVNQVIDRTPTNPDGGAPLQLVGYLMGTVMLTDFLMLDVGFGHFDSNIRIRDLDRDSVDLNLHYFLTSHLELVLNSRFEMLAFGGGGPSGGYSLLQLHYRL